MAWADFTLVASPLVVQERLGDVLSEYGFSVEWDGNTGRVVRPGRGKLSGWGAANVFDIELHTSPGSFTVVRVAPPRARGMMGIRQRSVPRELLDSVASRLRMAGILRGISVWE